MQRFRSPSMLTLLLLLAVCSPVHGIDDPCEMTEPLVFVIDPGPELAALGASLAGTRDPALAYDRPGIAVVLFPMPCGERALRVQVTIWNGFIVTHRRQTLRTLMSVAGVVKPEPPAWMSAFGAIGWPRESRFKLRRRIALSAGQSRISTVNGYGVAAFPVVFSDISAVSFVLESERRRIGRGGKIRRAQIRRHFIGVPIDGGNGSAAELEQVRRLLGGSDEPAGVTVPWP